MAREVGPGRGALCPNDAVAFFACEPSRSAGSAGTARSGGADRLDPVDALVTDAEFDTLSRVGETTCCLERTDAAPRGRTEATEVGAGRSVCSGGDC